MMIENSITKIYLVENCYGDPNKVYIGKEKYPKSGLPREYTHSKTYGNEIKFNFIDQIESLDRKDWKPLECFWINYFKFLGFEVLNKNEGGGGPSFHSEKTRNLISKPRLNFPKGTQHKNYLKPKPPRTLEHCENLSKSGKNNPKLNLRKPVLQYDLDGNFICEYPSMRLANVSLGKKLTNAGICECIRGSQKTAYGFIWKLKNI